MLSFPTRDVSVAAAHVDAKLGADDPVWMKGDALPAEGVAVSGRLSAAGPGRFYFSGRIRGEAQHECPRCLTDVRTKVEAEAHYVYGDDQHQGADDADTFSLTRGRGGEEVDLRPAIREQWILEVPAFALCRPDCKGLCPTCGADLNAGPHQCAETTADPRWDSLRKLKKGAGKS